MGVSLLARVALFAIPTCLRQIALSYHGWIPSLSERPTDGSHPRAGDRPGRYCQAKAGCSPTLLPAEGSPHTRVELLCSEDATHGISGVGEMPNMASLLALRSNPILDLRAVNRHLRRYTFRMLTHASLLRLDDGTTGSCPLI